METQDSKGGDIKKKNGIRALNTSHPPKNLQPTNKTRNNTVGNPKLTTKIN